MQPGREQFSHPFTNFNSFLRELFYDNVAAARDRICCGGLM